MEGWISRRRVLRSGVGVGGVLAVGTGRTGGTRTGCTPGHDDGDAPCRQVDDDASVRTGFDAAGTPLPVTFEYPCGWTTRTTSEYDDRSQANVTRSDFGDGNAYADVQVRTYYEPVSEAFIDQERESGDYVDVEYEYDGASRTGIVTSRETAQFGTVGHAVVPVGDAWVHVELSSTLKGTECTQPRPDYDLIRAMLASLEPNHKSTFPDASGHIEAYGLARIDTQWISYDDTTQRIEVPAQTDVLLPGITNVPPGRTMAVQVNSNSGEESAFFDLREDVQSRDVAERNWWVWGMTTDEFAAAEVGTEFAIKIRLRGAAGNINPGESIDGVVVEAPGVRRFAFTDQESLGEFVRVDALETTQGGVIVLTDADGTEVGSSERLAADERHRNIVVPLTDSLDPGEHDLTATVYRSENTPYQENAERTATITVDSAATQAGFVEVSDITPTSTEVQSPGTDLEVTATITNTGEQATTRTVRFRLAGSTEGTRSVTLEGGAETTVTFTVDTATLERGESAVFTVSTVDSSMSGTVSVASDAAVPSDTGSEQGDAGEDDDPADAEGTSSDGSGFDIGGAVIAALATLGLASHSDREA